MLNFDTTTSGGATGGRCRRAAGVPKPDLVTFIVGYLARDPDNEYTRAQIRDVGIPRSRKLNPGELDVALDFLVQQRKIERFDPMDDSDDDGTYDGPFYKSRPRRR